MLATCPIFFDIKISKKNKYQFYVYQTDTVPDPPQVVQVTVLQYGTLPLPLHVLHGSDHKSDDVSLPVPAHEPHVSSPITW